MSNQLTQGASSALATPMGQQVLKWGAIGVGAIILYFVGRKIYSNYKAGEEANTKESAQKKALANIKASIDKTRLNITEEQATLLANQLFMYMDGLGTDVKGLFTVARDKVRNQHDWNLITVAFGIRDKRTLGEWFVDELSQSDYKQLEKYLAVNGSKILQ